MRSTLVFYLLILLSCTYGDSISQINVQTIPASSTTGTNFPKDIASDSNYFYVSGSFSQSCDFGGVNITASNIPSAYLAKYNSAVNLVWVSTVPAETSFTSLAVLDQGDIVVGGNQRGFAIYNVTSLTTQSEQDSILVRYASNGSVVWAKNFGYNGTHEVLFVSSKNNKIAICAFMAGDVNYGGTNITQDRYTDSAVAKYDSNGNHIFSFGFTGEDVDDCGGIAIDSNDHTIVSFTSSSKNASINGTLVGNSGDRDIIVASFASDGSLLWFKRFGSLYAEGVYANGVDSSNNIFITGFFGSNITFGGPYIVDTTGYGAFLVKLDSNGNFVWQTFIQSVGNDFGKSITTGAFDSVYLAGTYTGTPSCQNVTFASATYGIFISKFNSSGSLAWHSTFSSSSSFSDTDIAVGPNLVFASVGFTSDISNGTDSIPVYGSANNALLASFSDIFPSASPSITPSVTPTPSRSPTASVTPTVSRTPSRTPTPSMTPTTTPTPSVTPSVTPTASVTPTVTPTTSVTPSITPTASVTPIIPTVKKQDNTVLIAGIAVAGSVIILGLVIFFVWKTKVQNRKQGITLDQLEMAPRGSERNLTQICDVEIQEKIGSGNFGEVFKGKWQGTTDVALKKLRNKELQDEFFSEASMMQELSIPNIVRFFGIFSDGTYFYLVTEFMSRGCLLNVLRTENLLPFDLLRMSLDAAAGMKYIASKGVVHRDLAARNLLVKEEDSRLVVKVADFGLSRLVTSSYYTALGSLFPVKWSPPEVLSHEKYTTKSDVWSFGVVLWEIFSYGAVPYPGKSNDEAMQMVLAGYRMPKPEACPDSVYQLMLRCWEEKASARPDFDEILSLLQKEIQVEEKEFKRKSMNNNKSDSTEDDDTHYQSMSVLKEGNPASTTHEMNYNTNSNTQNATTDDNYNTPNKL